MKVLDNSTNYITKIEYEYFDGMKKTYDLIDIRKYGQIKLLDEIDSAIVNFKLKNCAVSAVSDNFDITIYASVYGCSERNDGIVSIIDKKNKKVYYSDNDLNEDGTFKLNGEIYPKWRYDKCSIYYSLAESDLVMNGKITKDVTWRVFDLENGDFLYKLKKQDNRSIPKLLKSSTDKKIESISIITKSGKIIEFNESELSKQSAKKVFNNIIKYFKKGDLHDLNMKSLNEQENILTIRMCDEKFSLGIINNINDEIYYYNNGLSNNDFIEIDGETYPCFMVSDNNDVFEVAVMDFIITGLPSKRLSWRIEK